MIVLIPNFRAIPIFCVLALLLGCGPDTSISSSIGRTIPEEEIRYLVVSLVPDDSDFEKAVQHLAMRYGCDVLRESPATFEQLRNELQRLQPNHVAFVVEPDDLEQNFVARVMKLSTEIDSDPFVDFAYGFITGRDSQAAIQLIDASSNQHSNVLASISQFGVASITLPNSIRQKTEWPIRNGSIPVTLYMSEGDTDETRDQPFIQKSMVELDRQPILLFASHGYPDGMVGGPKASDIQGRDFRGSVALNMACYNGVTRSWFEDDWKSGKILKHEIDRDKSFCLEMIDNGVAAYVAYASPRPSGPTMMGDALLVATAGQSMGQLRQQDANSIVLAHLLSGAESLKISEVVEGDSVDPNRSPGESVRRSSTGGFLIGDPAYQPFPAKPDSDPRTQTVIRSEDRILVRVNVDTPVFHFYCSDQLGYWDGSQPAMRLEAAVPLQNSLIKDVQLKSSSFGDENYRLAAAVDIEEGRRILRIVANFPQPPMEQLEKLAKNGVVGQFEILLSTESDPSGDKRRVIRH